MCLAIPAKILKVNGNNAIADFGGVERDIRIDLVDAKVGDYVIVHTGYAIQKMDESDARKTLRDMKRILKNAK